MKRLLFVDDDPHVLGAMRNLLRRRRHEWDLVFATQASEAMDALETQPCDVIVSDLQMPGVGGAALLGMVKQRFPSVVRIVSSGDAAEAAVFECAGVAHQFLSKPFTSQSLVTTLERSCGLKAGLDIDPLRELIGRLDALPAVPATYLQLTEAVQQPNASAASLSRIVERDPAMAAKVLQLVSSSYFGLSTPPTSIGAACAYLGTEALKGLALCAHVFKSGLGRSNRLSLETVQQQSIAVAARARGLMAGTPFADAAFTAGLVHRVGQIALAAGLPAYDDVLVLAATAGRPVAELEREVLGATHAEIGGYLLGLWGLPSAIVDAVSLQHDPAQAPHTGLDLILAIHVCAARVEGVAPDQVLLRHLGLEALGESAP